MTLIVRQQRRITLALIQLAQQWTNAADLPDVSNGFAPSLPTLHGVVFEI